MKTREREKSGPPGAPRPPKPPKKQRKRKCGAPALFSASLTGEDAAEAAAFFSELDARCTLPRAEKAKLRADFEAALEWYSSAGVPLRDALERMALSNLGGFYSRPPAAWYPLDDAAKIYPLSMKHGEMAVFRLAVRLKEPVVPELLQIALTFVIKRFPSFATTVKEGFFWHYLDTSRRRYSVSPEEGLPCEALTVSRSGSQSFRVLYYKNRISAEYFHVLTDGAGGLAFLKALTAEYLRLLGAPACAGRCGLPDINAPCPPGETENVFSSIEEPPKTVGFGGRPALQMSGRLSRTIPCRVIHFKMDADALKHAAARRGATVTAYVLTLMFSAARAATDETEGDFCIQVPVDMRRYRPSDTVRNFSVYCGVKLPAAGVLGPDADAAEVSRQLAEKTSPEAMYAMAGSAGRLVSLLRYVPLFVKAPFARLIYGFLGYSLFTSTLSNLGVAELPPELAEHVENMEFVLGTAPTNRASCALVTFGGTASLSISKSTRDPSFEERLYDLFAADGVAPAAEGSPLYED